MKIFLSENIWHIEDEHDEAFLSCMRCYLTVHIKGIILRLGRPWGIFAILLFTRLIVLFVQNKFVIFLRYLLFVLMFFGLSNLMLISIHYFFHWFNVNK